MAKKAPAKRSKKTKADEQFQNRIRELYAAPEDLPASISIRQAEELMQRVKDLEVQLSHKTNAADTPGPGSPEAKPASDTQSGVLSETAGENIPTTNSGQTINHRHGFGLRGKLTIAITVTAVLAMFILGFFTYRNSQKTQDFLGGEYEQAAADSAKNQILNLLNQQALNVNAFFSEIDQTVTTSTSYTRDLLSQENTLAMGTYWDASQKLFLISGNAWDNPNTDTASVFIPNHTNFPGEGINAELNSVLYLDMLAPNILQTNPNVVAVYYIGKDDFTVYYPNIDLANLVPADQQTTDLLFYSIATPENDPDRTNKWTPPYQDPAGNGLMVTNSGPVYDSNGIFRGVIGVDLLLSSITTRIQDIQIGTTGFAFLMDPQGHIIAMPETGYTLWDITPENVPVNEIPTQSLFTAGPQELQPIFQMMAGGNDGLTTFDFNNVEYYAAYTPIAASGYSLAIIVPVSEMNSTYLLAQSKVAEQNQAFILEGVSLFLVLLAAAVVLSFLVSRILTSPLELLSNAAQRISAGDLEQTVNINTKDEISQLANTFNTMTAQLRNLIGSLERRVQDRTHDLELAAEVGRTITERVADMQEMLTAAAEMIRSRFNLYYTQVYLSDSSEKSLILRAGTGEVGQELLRRSHRLPLGPGSLNGRAATERKPVIVSDTAQSPTFLANPLLPRTRSEMAIPLIAGGRVIGVLDMQSELPGSLNELNLPAFDALAGQLAVAIQNADLFAQTQEARQQVETAARQNTRDGWQDFLNSIDRSERLGYLYNQTETLPITDYASALSNDVVDVPISVTGAEIGKIQILEKERVLTAQEQAIAASTAARLAQHIESLRLLAQAELYRAEAEQAVRQLTQEGWETYLKARAESASGFIYDQNEVRPLEPSANGHSAAALKQTLVVRDEPIGELEIDVTSPPPEASELLAAVAEQLSSHIENLRLSEQNRKRAVEMGTVAELSATTSSVLDPDLLLQTIVDNTKERFGVYHAHIYLANDSWQTLMLSAGAGEVGRRMVAAEHAIPMDAEQSLVARSVRERKAVIVNDVRGDPGFLPNPDLPETHAEMAVPMIVGDHVLGVFDVQSERVEGFSDEDASIYTTLASQVAVALQNARLYAEQAATVTQLRELDRLKSSFLANMSHELRTPLNSILGFSDVIIEGLDGPLTENMANDLQLIQKNGKHLLHLINDVLDMAKIEAGRMNLAPEKFNVNDVLDEVLGITSSLAGEKNLRLVLDEESDKEVTIFADRTRIRQVMINLVNNSIKFTDQGRIEIRASRPDADKVLIAVKDTGIGIPPDQLETIFQEFAQVDASTTRKAGGTGLGLPISRRLVEMHGGRLWAESSGVAGEGSTFFVEMPLQARITEPIERQEK
jgi:signal transduction histidine kinase/HAMP domain-containing protein